MIFVDGMEIGDIADVALRDRRMLSADGIFIVVVTIAEQDGRSVADPEVIFRGVPFMDQAVTADPVGGVQVRRRIKMYKALLGPEAAVYGDHVELSEMTRTGADGWSEHG